MSPYLIQHTSIVGDERKLFLVCDRRFAVRTMVQVSRVAPGGRPGSQGLQCPHYRSVALN